jgi:hypothetical protein
VSRLSSRNAAIGGHTTALRVGGSAGNVLGDVDCVRLKIPCAQIDGEKRLKKLGLPVIVEGAH